MSERDAETEAGHAESGGGLGELLKRAVYLGVGTLFATQETAVRMVKDLKLPREAVSLILEQVDRNRSELTGAIRSAVREVLREADLVKLTKRTLDGMNVEVSAEFKLNFDDKKKRDT